MTDRFKKFPKIGQFRHMLAYAETRHSLPGVIEFVGRPKVHGTNAAIGSLGGDRFYQSRNREITVEDDQFGFVAHMGGLSVPDGIHYGEWFGKGIQNGVAVAQLPKTFLHFLTWNDGWFQPTGGRGFHTIREFPEWELQVTTAEPSAAIEKAAELTMAVEARCPVAAALGVEGIGEGIVWMPRDPDLLQTSELWFKTKGEKHSSHVKALKPQSEAQTEARQLAVELATEQRYEQAVAYLIEMGLPLDRTSTGKLLSYAVKDVRAEEADRIAVVDGKEFNKHFGSLIRNHYFKAV